MTPQDADTESYRPQYEEITSPGRIASILRGLQQHHSIVSVAVPPARRLFNSTLLEVDPGQGYLLLDELSPREGHDLVRPASRIGISARRAGIEVKMALDVAEIGSDGKAAFYRLPFPTSIRYRQRRRAFRVPVSALRPIAVELTGADGTSLRGELHDISAGGMCVRFPPDTDVPEPGAAWPMRCRLALPGRRILQADFTLRRLVPGEGQRCLLAGGEFGSLDKAQARALERFVFEVQREERRRIINPATT